MPEGVVGSPATHLHFISGGEMHMSTIVIHGTDAREQAWYRVAGNRGFLDGLADGLQTGGRNPDVWTIGGRHVSKCGDTLWPVAGWTFFGGRKRAAFDQLDGLFRWSGANVHGERLDTDQTLVRYLEAVSKLTRNETIDIVAHSHGCNLVKMATRSLNGKVPLGHLVFLAAPHLKQTGTKDGYLYRLNLARLGFAKAGKARPVLNIYSDDDTVQTTVAAAAPDTWGAPPGLPKLGSFAGTPISDSCRTDPDPEAQAAYENLKLATTIGKSMTVHSALHGYRVAQLVGLWLAKWPQLSGEDCRQYFRIETLTHADVA
jgi:hypothetical protein